MSALTGIQVELLAAADASTRLTVSGHRYYLDGVEVDEMLRQQAADMVADGLLFVPVWAKPGKYKPVHATARGLALLRQVTR